MSESRFDAWATFDLSGQCRMQAKEQLDPEFSEFMLAVASRLDILASHLAGQSAGSGAEDIAAPVRGDLESLAADICVKFGSVSNDDLQWVFDKLLPFVVRAMRSQRKRNDTPAPGSTRTGDEGTEGLRALMIRALDGHTTYSRDCHLSGDYLCGKVWPLVEATLAARPAAPEAQGAEISQAAADVLAERRRQVEGEGWTPEHDDQHSERELGLAAACYASAVSPISLDPKWSLPSAVRLWPWDNGWWKPSYYRRNLVKAGALILAEIERLDRLPAPPASSGQEG